MRLGQLCDTLDRFVRMMLSGADNEQQLREWVELLDGAVWAGRPRHLDGDDDEDDGNVPSWWHGDEEAARSSMAAGSTLRR